MKLITKAIEKKLLATPLGSQDGKGGDADILVKFFYPYGAGTWLVTEAERLDNGDWRFFGAVTLGMEWEWGYFMFSELQSVRKFGRPAIERDMYGAPTKVSQEWKDA